MSKFSLILAFHNHQPVGNFSEVIEQAYQKSYKPFLDVVEKHPNIKVSIHNSGCLMDWLDVHHPAYLERLDALVLQGRVEVLTGGWYEPILSSIPIEDRLGQIRKQSRYLEARTGRVPNGLWMTERVWEPELASTLHRAGVTYTFLDDSHFQLAGLEPGRLHGYFLTEDQGKFVAVFPIRRELRYTMPFKDVQATIDLLRGYADLAPEGAAIMGDDGEKFGLWPGTYELVYERGWLEELFQRIVSADWLDTVLPSQFMNTHPPLGKAYLPTASYPEMNLWTLPAQIQAEYKTGSSPVPGNTWRAFFSRYPESDHLHKRVTDLAGRLRAEPVSRSEDVWNHVWAAQCNCAYWHGVFGGLYLPHLRDGLYRELLAAEKLLESQSPPVPVRVVDYDQDGDAEVFLSSPQWTLVVSPGEGGTFHELSHKSGGVALQNGMSRRFEAYHQKIRDGRDVHGGTGSIHDLPEADEGLRQRLHYDSYRRVSLVDHFLTDHAEVSGFENGTPDEAGDFVSKPYRCALLENGVRLSRTAPVVSRGASCLVELLKEIRLEGELVVVDYSVSLLEGAGLKSRFGVEWNLTVLSEEARVSHGFEVTPADKAELVDPHRGFRIRLEWSKPCGLWKAPVETVSLSETGFETVYQSTSLMPVWPVVLNPGEQFNISFHLKLEAVSDLQRTVVENSAK